MLLKYCLLQQALKAIFKDHSCRKLLYTWQLSEEDFQADWRAWLKWLQTIPQQPQEAHEDVRGCEEMTKQMPHHA